MQLFVFVYAKDNNVKVLSLDESSAQDGKLKAEGWKHTATLDAKTFIKFLLENTDTALESLYNLKK